MDEEHLKPYHIMGDVAENLLPLVHITSREEAPRQWEVAAVLQDGLEPFPELCAWISGLVSAGSQHFGYLPAKVTHDRCQCDGATACHYRVHWEDADQHTRDYRMALIRVAALEHRLDEFQDIVAELVGGENTDDVISQIVRKALHVSFGSSCALVVNPGVLGPEQMVYEEGMDPDTVARLTEALSKSSAREDTRRSIFDVRSGHELYGHLVVTDASTHVRLRAPKLVATYARLAATVLANARMMEQIRHNALHDTLTGVANRALILDRLEQMLGRGRRNRVLSAVLFIDLDGFKQINDTLGHDAGDEVLRMAAARMSAAVRPGDTVGRLGGDEFVVLLHGEAQQLEPRLMAKRLLDAMAEPFELDEWSASPVVLTASIGIATTGSSAAVMLRDADLALYSAKQQGKNRSVIFQPEMQAAVERQMRLEADLQVALERSQFYLDYQPIFDLPSGTVTAVEALLRWRHPEQGILQSKDFSAVLEETDAIFDVGRWILNQACSEGARLVQLGHPIPVSVNVSIRQLKAGRLEGDIREALDAAGLEAGSLILNITEAVLTHEREAAVPLLKRLRESGVRVAIDDLGIGYSSLAHLQQLPVDMLKIDRSFISAISPSRDAGSLVHTLVQLGKHLGLATLAEGVDEGQQLTTLQRRHFDGDEGFVLAKPISRGDLQPFLASWPSSTATAEAG